MECPRYGIDIKWKPAAGLEQQKQKDQSTPAESPSSSVSTPGTSVQRQPPNDGSLLTRIHRSLPESMRHPRTLQLLQHYVQKIAPSFAWIDGPQNLYCDGMLSICLDNPSVRYALFALSAFDLAARLDQCPREYNDLIQLGEEFRNEVLSLVANDMKRLAQQAGEFVRQHRCQARSMLAAVFLLVNMSIRIGCHEVLKLHMRTADVLVQSWISAVGPSALSESSIEISMIHMLCDTQIWCSITRAVVLPDRRQELASRDSNTPLSSLVMAIHSITELERQQSRSRQYQSSLHLDWLLIQLGNAWNRALQHCKLLENQKQKPLESVITMFYQAALVYLYRVCISDDSADAAVVLPTRRLFDALRDVPDLVLVAHHLAWPLFIAGSESGGNTENQAFVEAMLGKVIRLSGTMGRSRLMQFLRELWKRSRASGQTKWIMMAIEWEQRGATLTIF